MEHPTRTILITTSSFGVGGDDPSILLREEGYAVVHNPYKRKLSEEEVRELIGEYRPVGIIAGVEPLTERNLAGAVGLKVISRCGAGIDSVDLTAAEKLGIAVTATYDAVTIPVAELTVGLIIGLLRQIYFADAAIRRGDWDRPMGRLLYKKTVGIVGLGRIGTYLSGLLVPFGCRLVGSDPVLTTHGVCDLVELDELMGISDIITLHLPYTKENHQIISRDRIRRMKEGAVLINAARGGLVDEDALGEAIRTGRLSGAALDCYQEEPYRGYLAELPQVLLTSHIGSYAVEARVMMERRAVDNLLYELNRQGVPT